MSVANKHPLFRRTYMNYFRVKHALLGSGEIKRYNTVYLPIPAAMLADFPAPSHTRQSYTHNHDLFFQDTDRSDYHPNPAYRSYLQRARFPDIPSNTLAGLMGVACNNKPTINLPSSHDYLEHTATPDGRSLEALYFDTLAEVMSYGRTTLVIDINPTTNQFMFVPYDALSFINWRGGLSDGRRAPVQAVFKERNFRPQGAQANQNDRFGSETNDAYRVLEIDPATSTYFSETFEKEQSTNIIVPEYQGRTIDYLPLQVIGSMDLGLDPNKIPLLGIADIAIQMYQKDADMSSSQFLSCNPMLTLIGAEEEESPSAVGSNVALILNDSSAKAQYTEPAARSLENVRSTLNDLRSEAAHHGAGILGSDKRGSESAEALRLRKAAATATLSTMVTNVNLAFNNLFKMISDWSGTTFNNPFYVSNDFAGLPLTHQDRAQLVSEWQSGIISKETVRDNLREARIIKENVTDEEIDAQIEKEVTEAPQPAAQPLNPDSLGDDNDEN